MLFGSVCAGYVRGLLFVLLVPSSKLFDVLKSIHEYRVNQCKNVKAYAIEMELVVRRMDWLSIVLNGDDTRINALIKKCEESSDAASADASSRDWSSAARADPCLGFEQLEAFSILAEKAVGFRTCASQDEIKAHLATTQPARSLYSVLQAACKAAITDLNSAKASREATEALKKRKADTKAQQGNNVKKRAQALVGRGRPGQTKQHLFLSWSPEADDYTIKSAAAWNPKWDLFDPFVITGADKLLKLDDEKLELVKSFGNVFDASSMKVTEGRAQLPIEEGQAKSVRALFASLVPSNLQGRLLFEAGDDRSPDLSKALVPSTFGVAMGFTSIARYELSSMSCLRKMG